jgi:hypothetical protein
LIVSDAVTCVGSDQCEVCVLFGKVDSNGLRSVVSAETEVFEDDLTIEQDKNVGAVFWSLTEIPD